MDSEVVSKLNEAVERLSFGQVELSKKLESVADKTNRLLDQVGDKDYQEHRDRRCPEDLLLQQQRAFSPTQEDPDCAAEVFREYEQVRDSLQRIKLPNELKLFDTQAGIKQECKGTLKVISKAGRFTETALRWVIDSQAERYKADDRGENVLLPSQKIQDLFAIFTAEMNFLKEEYTALLVKSTLNEEISRLFRSLEGNKTAFSPQSLQNVRIAAELSTIQARQNSGTFTRGRGRGYRGRMYTQTDGYPGHRNRDQDIFSSFTSRRHFGPDTRQNNRRLDNLEPST